MFSYIFSIEGMDRAVHVTAQTHPNDELAVRVAAHLVDHRHPQVRVGRGHGLEPLWLGEWRLTDGLAVWTQSGVAAVENDCGRP
jgi:hypothetical protein